MNSYLLIQSDAVPFLLWWGASILFGIGFYPVGAVLFRTFDDKGWLFSKALGIGIGGYLTFVLCRFKLLLFTGTVCIGVTLASAVLSWILFLRFGSKELIKRPDWKQIIQGEIFFFLVFLFWTYCSGFRPEASGTEKPMDYGFMKAIMQSTEVPAKDIWYSQGTLNYYYGGQFYAVYLTKLTFTRVNETYHLMKALVAAFTFSLSRALIRQALKDRGLSGSAAELGGLFAGLAVSFAGNVHYLLYGLFGSVFQLSGWEDYWFPSSTRFIGHNPLTDDQCIHEFPSYSFVLGDLHAHMINLFLVLVFIGIMYAWFQKAEISAADGVGCDRKIQNNRFPERPSGFGSILSMTGKLLRTPHILAAGILIGIFKWTNYWDFIIYLTVFLFSSVCIFFRGREEEYSNSKMINTNLRGGYSNHQEEKNVHPGRRTWILQIVLSMVIIYLLQTLTAWPFTSQFVTMFKGVAIAENHTALYQFLILWGVPILTALLLAAAVFSSSYIRQAQENSSTGICQAQENSSADIHHAHESSSADIEKKHENSTAEIRRKQGNRRSIHDTDVFFLMLSVCAIGLVLIPELVYVRDIYEQGYARSNTMFKLTYQAFVMFGLLMSYTSFRILCPIKKSISLTEDAVPEQKSVVPVKILTAVCTFVIFLTFGYGIYAVNCWYGNILDPSGYQGLDAESFLETEYPEDAGAVRWLEEHVSGQPVVLEAPGDSYSEYCRVSAYTGLPTVEGWYVHEWLWRDDPEDLNLISEDIYQIYTGQDPEYVQRLLSEYEVSYIFIGSCERELYGELLNEELLRSLGTVCYDGQEEGIENGACIIAVGSLDSSSETEMSSK